MRRPLFFPFFQNTAFILNLKRIRDEVICTEYHLLTQALSVPILLTKKEKSHLGHWSTRFRRIVLTPVPDSTLGKVVKNSMGYGAAWCQDNGLLQTTTSVPRADYRTHSPEQKFVEQCLSYSPSQKLVQQRLATCSHLPFRPNPAPVCGASC